VFQICVNKSIIWKDNQRINQDAIKGYWSKLNLITYSGKEFLKAPVDNFVILEFGKIAHANFPVHIFEWKVLFLKNIRYQI
jgi:hypothetical protein